MLVRPTAGLCSKFFLAVCLACRCTSSPSFVALGDWCPERECVSEFERRRKLVWLEGGLQFWIPVANVSNCVLNLIFWLSTTPIPAVFIPAVPDTLIYQLLFSCLFRLLFKISREEMSAHSSILPGGSWTKGLAGCGSPWGHKVEIQLSDCVHSLSLFEYP